MSFGRQISVAALAAGFAGLGILLSPGALEARLEKGIERCATAENPHRCRAGLAASLLDSFSAGEIQRAAAAARARGVPLNCHELMHYLGRDSYRRAGSVTAFAGATPACESGFYHGIIEEFLADRPGLVEEESGAILVGECLRHGSPRALNEECYHGVGHALMLLLGNDLPRSLLECDRLFKSSAERRACYGGAFMENALSVTGDHPSVYRDPSRPLFPCTIFGESYLDQCYFAQGRLLVQRAAGDPREAFRECAGAPYKHREWCYAGASVEVGLDRRLSMRAVADFCVSLRGEFGDPAATACIDETARKYADPTYEGARSARRFCGVFPTDDRNRCFAALGKYASQWRPPGDDAVEFCRPLGDPVAVAFCTNSSRGAEPS